MRYNHRFHQSLHGTRRQRRFNLASWSILLVIITILVLVFNTRLDPRDLLGGFLLSLYRVVVAYFISLALALAIGLLAVGTTLTEAMLLPILDVSQSFPSFALLPILVHYFGHSNTAVIVILVIAMIWPILFNVISGVHDQKQDQAEAAVLFGATGWKNFRYYRWPMLRPHIMTGSIVSWGEAWDVIVGAEIIAGVIGAGQYLGSLGSTGQTSLLLLGIMVYLLLIFGLNQVIWLPLLHRYTKYQTD